MKMLRLLGMLSIFLTLILVNACKRKRQEMRVVGGTEVNELVPYQLSLQKKHRDTWEHFCSGSIISEKFLLTAGHCVVYSCKNGIFTVVPGTLNWKKAERRHLIVARHLHPSYDQEMLFNDIGLMEVDPPFPLHTGKIKPVLLDDETPVGGGVSVRVTGWGYTKSGEPEDGRQLSNQLQELVTKTLTNEACARKYRVRVKSYQLCTSSPGAGSCNGDSGGPLVLANGQNNQLVGIVSFGVPSCNQSKADIYTRISSFVPYIRKILKRG